jgi:hypothetical protein
MEQLGEEKQTKARGAQKGENLRIGSLGLRASWP